jgi:hypothetical protein
MKYLTVGEFTPEEVLPFAGKGARPRDYQVGEIVYHVKMNSLRYDVFKKALTCAGCGLVGTKFLLQYDAGQDPTSGVQPHFNLYGVNEAGELVLMTKDHEQPRSKGGADVLDNLRTMCFPCNFLKGSRWDND